MSDITLKSGKVVKVDVSDLTTAEWRKFIGKDGTQADEDAVVMKCTGLTEAEISKLPIQEFRALVIAIVRATQEPLADPN